MRITPEGPESSDKAEAEGTFSIKIVEKPYYLDSELVHSADASSLGTGRKSSGSTWHFAAGGRYAKKAKGGTVHYGHEGDVVVEFDLSPDGPVEGRLLGIIPWDKLHFKALASAIQ